jgi:hypothetical protein
MNKEFKKIYKQIDHIEGWLPKRDARALWEEAREVEGVIVEIGAWCGRSSKLLCLSSPKSKVFSVDTCKGVDENHFIFNSEIGPRLMREMGGMENWHLMKMTSRQASKLWNGGIDLLFVDGGHSYEIVRLDLLSWSPYVKGPIIMHDYNDNEFPGVKKAFREFVPVEDHKKIEDKGGLAIYRI